MEKKIFSTMDGTDYPTDIPLDLVETIEKNLLTDLYFNSKFNLQCTPFILNPEDPNILQSGVMEKLENGEWKLSYEIIIKKR